MRLLRLAVNLLILMVVKGWFPSSRGTRTGASRLYMGFGRGEGPLYRWEESEEDLEVVVPLTEDTGKRDLEVVLNSTALSVRYKSEGGAFVEGAFRRKIALAGSFWSLDTEADGSRILVAHLEKRPPVFDNDFTWGGIFRDEVEEDFVRHYRQEEDFDFDDYVANLPDYNESLVDKTMFGNVTEQLLGSLKEQGLVRDELDDPLPDNEDLFTAIDREAPERPAPDAARVSENERLILEKIRQEFGADVLDVAASTEDADGPRGR